MSFSESDWPALLFSVQIIFIRKPQILIICLICQKREFKIKIAALMIGWQGYFQSVSAQPDTVL